jgi:hypothetical protein
MHTDEAVGFTHKDAAFDDPQAMNSATPNNDAIDPILFRPIKAALGPRESNFEVTSIVIILSPNRFVR